MLVFKISLEVESQPQLQGNLDMQGLGTRLAYNNNNIISFALEHI